MATNQKIEKLEVYIYKKKMLQIRKFFQYKSEARFGVSAPSVREI